MRSFIVTDISQSTECFMIISTKPQWAQGRTVPCRWTPSKCEYDSAIPLLAVFVSAHVHLKGLEGSSSVFVLVSWLLAIQTESLLATSPFSDPLLFLSTIRCWNFLHTDTGVRSEWSCRYFYVMTEITLVVFPWIFRHRLLLLLRIIISTHRLKKDGFTTPT